VILLEAFLFAVFMVLMPSDRAKPIASTAVTTFFTLVTSYTRPYVEDVEDFTDIAGRMFMLIMLAVGIALNEGVGRRGQIVCGVILACVVIASNSMFLVLLNPLKLVRGVMKAICETRHAVTIAGWNVEFIQNMQPDDLKHITAEDAAQCSPLQVWQLLKYHGGTVSMRSIFNGVIEFDVSDFSGLIKGKG
jgi:hypothetical protein